MGGLSLFKKIVKDIDEQPENSNNVQPEDDNLKDRVEDAVMVMRSILGLSRTEKEARDFLCDLAETSIVK